MDAISLFAVLIFFGAGIGYFVSYVELFNIINDEKPDWLKYKGSLSMFYEGLPRIGDPNILARVVSVAFSKKVRELNAPEAVWCAQRIRFLLPISVFSFFVFVFFLTKSSP